MSKVIDSLVQNSIDSKNYPGVVLVRMEFTGSVGFQRLNSSFQTIYWDEGSGEEAYLGVGDYGSVDVLPETGELGAISVNLKLSGIPNETLANAFSDEYRGQPVYIWYAVLDRDTYAVVSDSPILIFAGLMDYAVIDFGETASVSISATSRLATWERQKGGTFNAHYQKTYVDPTDTAFDGVLALQNKEISWGKYLPGQTYSGSRSGGSGRRSGGG